VETYRSFEGSSRRTLVAWGFAVTAALGGALTPAAAQTRPGPALLKAGAVAYELTTSSAQDEGRCGLDGRHPTPCPLVVLVSGFSVPLVMWDDTVVALRAANYSVLRFDLYGRGRSARPRVAYTAQLFAAQLAALLAHVGVNVPFDIVGSSMGGPITAVYANEHPAMIKKVVLVSPAGLDAVVPAFTTIFRVPWLGDAAFAAGFRPLLLDHLQDNLRASVYQYPKVLAAFRQQLAYPGTAEAMLSTLRETMLKDFTAEFRRLGMLGRPTLIVWGADDILVPEKMVAPQLRRLFPHATYEKIPRAGHLPQIEQPAAFNRHLGRFLSLP
jgi:pimeloyl-ACP methyl ester carboxylesterase